LSNEEQLDDPMIRDHLWTITQGDPMV